MYGNSGRYSIVSGQLKDGLAVYGNSGRYSVVSGQLVIQSAAAADAGVFRCMAGEALAAQTRLVVREPLVVQVNCCIGFLMRECHSDLIENKNFILS